MMFGFEVTVVNKKGVFLKMTAFLNGAPCSLIEIDQHFRHAHSLQLAPLKRQSVSASLHDAPFQKAVIFIPIALRTWNLTWCISAFKSGWLLPLSFVEHDINVCCLTLTIKKLFFLHNWLNLVSYSSCTVKLQVFIFGFVFLIMNFYFFIFSFKVVGHLMKWNQHLEVNILCKEVLTVCRCIYLAFTSHLKV